jgi:hypothetical protein
MVGLIVSKPPLTTHLFDNTAYHHALQKKPKGLHCSYRGCTSEITKTPAKRALAQSIMESVMANVLATGHSATDQYRAAIAIILTHLLLLHPGGSDPPLTRTF